MVNQASSAAKGGAAFFKPPLAPFVPSNRFVGDRVLRSFPLDFPRLACVSAANSDRFTEQPHALTSLRQETIFESMFE